jgi:uncharacterized protein (TIGR00251 family)
MEQLRIQQAGNSLIFSVKVVPRSSKTAFVGVLGDMLKIKLAAAPEKGKANELLIDFLAQTLGIKKNTVKITSGLSSQVKTIRITGISVEVLFEKLKM